MKHLAWAGAVALVTACGSEQGAGQKAEAQPRLNAGLSLGADGLRSSGSATVRQGPFHLGVRLW